LLTLSLELSSILHPFPWELTCTDSVASALSASAYHRMSYSMLVYHLQALPQAGFHDIIEVWS
jgi:hypothetical protein